MPSPRLAIPPATRFAEGFARIRRELDVPEGPDPEALAEARRVRDRRTGRRDRTDVPLVTIDPPGSRDLDQAFWAARRDDGFHVVYAIADVGAFVGPGSSLDRQAWARGTTLYPPDGRVPLHPAPLSEDVASLLPGVERPALVWDLHLDEAARPASVRLTAATVRSRTQLTYAAAARRAEWGADDDPLVLLGVIGRRRAAAAAERGAIHLPLPSQEVVAAEHGYDLVYDVALPIEDHNAQISLLTGMVAADGLVEAGHGLLRTLPAAEPETLSGLRRAAHELGLAWPDEVTAPAFVRGLDPAVPAEAAMLVSARSMFRGADYVPFHGAPPSGAEHAAIASTYTHVTAPLRRLCDRFVNEILLAHHADREAPAWAVEALDRLPDAMRAARARDGRLERAVVDLVEAVLLSDRVGEVLDAVVVDRRGDDAVVQVTDPAVVARATGPADRGTRVGVRVVEARPEDAVLRLEVV